MAGGEAVSTDSARPAQIGTLRAQGYVVVPNFLTAERVRSLQGLARQELLARRVPLELEADLRYPGAPPSRSAAGGQTVRRLLDAYARNPEFAASISAPAIVAWMKAYFGESVLMSRAHHNCLMTKHPDYGSLTGWHRDSRYWSFARDDLVSVWLALGPETTTNGALWFVPGSHAMEFSADQFDAQKFFRSDRADNAALLGTAQSPPLNAGDAVFFHSNTLHSAGLNRSDAVKFSLVSTYHARSNPPQAGTRSDSVPEVELG
jgi:phytanoyl-CoA hydroxylase